MRFVSCLSFAFVANASFAGTMEEAGYRLQASGESSYEFVQASDAAQFSPAAVSPALDGTWAGRVAEADGSTRTFVMEMAEFQRDSSPYSLPVAAAAFPQADGTRTYRGVLLFPTTPPQISFTVTLNGESIWLRLDWNGLGFKGMGTVAGGRVVTGSLERTGDAHPFTFRSGLLHINAAPRESDDGLLFASQHTAVTMANFAVAGTDGAVLSNYFLKHFVAAGRLGQGGVISLKEAVASTRFSPCAFYTKLDNATRPAMACAWATSGAMVSATPLVFRFDNDAAGIHMTLAELEPQVARLR